MPVVRAPEKIRFVWTLCEAVDAELKAATASELMINAPVNAPARPASLRPVDIGVREDLFGPPTPDRLEDQDDHDRGDEEGRDLVLAGRAEPQDPLADVRDCPANGPDRVAVELGRPRVGAL